jgi:hypothetical protein
MNQFIKNFRFGIKLLLPFNLVPAPLVLTRTTEKFDVVAQAPKYTRIRFPEL